MICELSNLGIGIYAENIAVNEFLKYGFDVYTTVVDEKGIDFIVRNKYEDFYYIQVKSCRNNNYQFIREEVFRKKNDYYVCYIRIKENDEYDIYLIPSRAWNSNNQTAFVCRPKGKRTKERGINYSKTNAELFNKYKFENTIAELKKKRQKGTSKG